MKVTIQSLIEGGSASAGPPLGPALGPMGVNIGQVIAAINDKTKDFAGLKVPVKVVIEKETKKFEIIVGSPPVSALIKKELKKEKGAKDKTESIGNLELTQVVKLADMKKTTNLSKTTKALVKEILGTCVSLGVTCEGKSPKEVIKEINEGKFDSLFKN
ncbi:50S ribosomal protein L11 [Candidatus Micrarchaeota archaeon]|nr:50S ribosomal protein L11 [Candidatus Micrarchaeota archaeon]